MTPTPPSTTVAQQPLIQNPFNQLLAQKHAGLATAKRYALGTVCDPSGQPQPPTGASLRRQLKFIQINAQVTGDNVLIPQFSGRKQIYEVVIWNAASQTLLFQQGVTGNNPIPLFNIPGMPGNVGFTLGFNGNFDMPHWEVDNNQPLVLNLSAGSQVTGFIRYRIDNGTS